MHPVNSVWSLLHYKIVSRSKVFCFARGFGLVVKHSTADPGIASSIPLTPTEITKRRYVLFFPMENASVYQCFTLSTLKNLVCHVWWALQYLALWATNINLLSVCPDAEWAKPECVAKQKQPPSICGFGNSFETCFYLKMIKIVCSD